MYVLTSYYVCDGVKNVRMAEFQKLAGDVLTQCGIAIMFVCHFRIL